MKPLFIVSFTDGTEFTGGCDFMNTKWKQIPDRPIVKISYLLPNGKYLKLSNFKRIYQYIEGTNDLNGKNAGKFNIEFSYLLVQKGDTIRQYKIYRKTGYIDDVTYYNVNNDYILKLNPDYWRKGNNV